MLKLSVVAQRNAQGGAATQLVGEWDALQLNRRVAASCGTGEGSEAGRADEEAPPQRLKIS